jgi:hypothetical protein
MKAFKTGVRWVAMLAPVAVALSLPLPAHADVAAPNAAAPGGVTLAVTANGSGCRPGGTVRTNVDRDNNGFRAEFDQLAAMAGGRAQPVDARRNCQFNLRVNGMPDGYQYTVVDAVYRGFGHLAAGATGLQRTTYYFQGSTDSVSPEHRFAGPLNDFWTVRDRGPTVWSPCHLQRNANINLELRASAGAPAPAPLSFLSMTSWENRAFARFRLAWRTC